MRNRILDILVGVAIGVISVVGLNAPLVWAQLTQVWPRDKVVPIVLVKPSFGSFVPTDGNTIGISWTKEQVIPMVIVKPSFGNFVPAGGTTIGISWTQSEVKPVIFVESYMGSFVASSSISQDSAPGSVQQPSNARAGSSGCASPIETHIDGDFEGWDDGTIYSMDDGSIWRQSTYHYHYHYAYHPSVLIFQAASGTCHVKVDGDDDEGADVVRIK